MKVKMIKTTLGSEDGKTTNSYAEGQVYDMAEKLAKIFVNVLNVAAFLPEEIAQVTKMAGASPENKAAKKGKEEK